MTINDAWNNHADPGAVPGGSTIRFRWPTIW